MFTNAISTAWLMLCILLACPIHSNAQKLLAVLDLDADGKISKDICNEIADKISEQAKTDTRFTVYDRSMYPYLFSSLDIDNIDTCSQPKCLTEIGNLIGANIVVGGTIEQARRQFHVYLMMVDAATGMITGNADFTIDPTKTGTRDLTIAVNALLNAYGTRTPEKFKVRTKKEKGFFRKPLVWVNIGVIGAAGAAAAVYFALEGSGEQDGKLSMDDAPLRVR
ncbi:MAG: hypothetical protein GF398_04165 [Chitinivibrionales bacterium]|nr:hypothetical protein [Chitinivibrionales bacterium]